MEGMSIRLKKPQANGIVIHCPMRAILRTPGLLQGEGVAVYYDGMGKNVIHISEAEAARDFASRMARVRRGAEVVIENDAPPVAVVSRAFCPVTVRRSAIPRKPGSCLQSQNSGDAFNNTRNAQFKCGVATEFLPSSPRLDTGTCDFHLGSVDCPKTFIVGQRLAKMWASEKRGLRTSISSAFLGRLSSGRI